MVTSLRAIRFGLTILAVVWATECAHAGVLAPNSQFRDAQVGEVSGTSCGVELPVDEWAPTNLAVPVADSVNENGPSGSFSPPITGSVNSAAQVVIVKPFSLHLDETSVRLAFGVRIAFPDGFESDLLRPPRLALARFLQ